MYLLISVGLPRWCCGKESAWQKRRHKRHGFDPWVGKIWRRAWQPTPVFLPGKPHEQRGLVGYSPRGCKESETTKQLSTVSTNAHTFSYSHINFSEPFKSKLQPDAPFNSKSFSVSFLKTREFWKIRLKCHNSIDGMLCHMYITNTWFRK